METLNPILNVMANVIALIGCAIIVIGIVVSAYRLVLVEIAAFRRFDVEHDRRTLRHHLGYYLLLGLEFIVAADVVRTIIHPGMEELLILGVVVLIRTVISLTLNWELSRVKDVREEHP